MSKIVNDLNLGISISMEKTLKASRQSKSNIVYYPISHLDLSYVNICPLCSSPNIEIISDVSLDRELIFFQTAVCSDCFHGFRSILPKFSWFQSRWKQISTPFNNKVFNPSLEESRKIRYTQYCNIVKKYKPSGEVLDIGAGYGTGSSVFSDAGYNVETLEVEDDRINYIRNAYKLKVHTETVDQLTTLTKRYDLVIFSHCLEHIDNPIVALKSLCKIIADDGFVYLEIPIIWNIVDWKDSFFMAHKSNFNEKGIIKILEFVGFSIVDKFVMTCVDTGVDNIGFVLTKKCKNNTVILEDKTLYAPLLDPMAMSVSNIKKMYSYGSADLDLNSSDPIRYSVPYIDNFFHIVRSDKGSFLDNRSKSGFFEFIPD
jgi:SAM-dependent methyltransferase